MEGMENEIIIALVGAIFGGVVTYITTLLLDKRKEKREDRIEARKERKLIFENRPEMEVVDYKDYIKRTGYGIKQKCDVEVFVAKIEKISITGKKKRDTVFAHYRDNIFNPADWCCVIYEFKNAGKTDVSTFNIVCNYQKDTCIFESDSAEHWAKDNLLNYWSCFDKKIRVGDTITVKFCYHKDCVIGSMISAIMSIIMEDDNGRYWTQPLFAPENKIYDSQLISYQEYRNQINTDIAEECFKKPWLW